MNFSTSSIESFSSSSSSHSDKSYLPHQMSVCVPPCLQLLTNIDQLLVEQKVEFFQTHNRYTIKNNQGQNVYYAVEEGGCCTRMCRPSMSSLNILDNYENEVIHFRRHRTCNYVNCFPFCWGEFQKLEVYSPPGTSIGSVKETWTWCGSKFDVKNENGDVVLKIEGPADTCSCFGQDIDFRILSVDESEEVGKISKQWSGLMRELFTTADYFGVSFPVDLDIRMKAVLFGACFLIDYMFFEGKDNRHN